ncbi:alpha/beta hydrolase family protein [Actinoplanes sp. CA-015351]|uniref:alpha/beta hydrolase family protein n=1 Tax=Actinoplanes sp. CA-015351 TaxID=3239897 RepID=UPI003D9629DE
MPERVRFASTRGPELAGLIDPPAEPVRGWGVFAHGFALSKDSPAASRTCKQLASEGIGMLRFDALGLGDSDGDWGDGSFDVKVDDTVRAAEFLAGRGTPPDILVGHSLGGAAVIAAAGRAPSVRAVATIGAPFEPKNVERHYEALVDRVIEDGHAEWLVGGKALILKRSLVEDFRRAELRHHVIELGLPLLVMHSPTDSTVDVANASRIFQAARHPRSFVSLEGSDHLLTAPGQAQRAARVISAWADPYLPGQK